MPASKVPAKIRAAAIADLHAGEQPAVVAERYKLDRNTVKMWKQRYVTDAVTDAVTTVPAPQPIVKPSAERQKRTIGALVLDLLAAKLEASAAIAKAASDPAWLAKQRGSELAAVGQWLDSTALAIGDRLAGGAAADGDDPAGS